MATTQIAKGSSPPEVLYHYTTSHGLLGIFETGSIWATNIRYLNDAEEFVGAMNLIGEVLREGRSKDWSRYMPRWDEVEEVLKKVRAPVQSFPIFVTSFSEEKDSLEQWRAYGGPDGGFSIGFELNALKELAKVGRFRLEKCLYGDRQKRKHVRERIAAALKESERKGLNDYRTNFALMKLALSLAPILKHKAFRKEREWRLVHKPGVELHPGTRFRFRDSMLIQYVGVRLGDSDPKIPESISYEESKKTVSSRKRLPVREVWVAPTPNEDLARESLESFLRHRVTGPKEGPLAFSSKVPYRPW